MATGEEVSLRKAARTIGAGIYTTDRFVRDAIVWLASRGPIQIEWIPKNEKREDGWAIRGVEPGLQFYSGDDRLDWALVGAVHAVASIEALT